MYIRVHNYIYYLFMYKHEFISKDANEITFHAKYKSMSYKQNERYNVYHSIDHI